MIENTNNIWEKRQKKILPLKLSSNQEELKRLRSKRTFPPKQKTTRKYDSKVHTAKYNDTESLSISTDDKELCFVEDVNDTKVKSNDIHPINKNDISHKVSNKTEENKTVIEISSESSDLEVQFNSKEIDEIPNIKRLLETSERIMESQAIIEESYRNNFEIVHKNDQILIESQSEVTEPVIDSLVSKYISDTLAAKTNQNTRSTTNEKTIMIKFQLDNEKKNPPINLNIVSNKPIGKHFYEVSSKCGVSRSKIEFFFDGNILNDSFIPDQDDMDDGDIIDIRIVK